MLSLQQKEKVFSEILKESKDYKKFLKLKKEIHDMSIEVIFNSLTENEKEFLKNYPNYVKKISYIYLSSIDYSFISEKLKNKNLRTEVSSLRFSSYNTFINKYLKSRSTEEAILISNNLINYGLIDFSEDDLLVPDINFTETEFLINLNEDWIEKFFSNLVELKKSVKNLELKLKDLDTLLSSNFITLTELKNNLPKLYNLIKK